jgi:alginate O-acetyltransferase complex protein AlgI
MLFNTISFWFFLLVVWALYFALPLRRRWAVLLVASLYFYMAWRPEYVLLLLWSALIDFVVAQRLEKTAHRFRWILASLVMNLGLLFVFKYWDFAQQSIAATASLLGFSWTPVHLGLLLPVGISFYTFQTLSYTIDVYRGELQSERNWARFLLFVCYFPQLVAGPIERASNLLPQLKAGSTLDGARVVSGLQLALWGLFKKTVIADRLGIYVDGVYLAPEHYNGPTLLVATWAFAFQIYCDFSGYTDIAIGVSRMFGFELLKNFDAPYFATSIRDFWRRWHMSLSTWLRDYLYVSLGGNRRGAWNTYRNLFLTMLLGGLWHGASWNFVIWGALHGIFLAVSRATLDARDAWLLRSHVPSWLSNTVRTLITFHLVCFCWIFFRASTFADALEVIRGMIWRMSGELLVAPVVFLQAGCGIVLLLFVDFIARRRPAWWQKAQHSDAVRLFASAALLAMVIHLGLESTTQFIYFQF